MESGEYADVPESWDGYFYPSFIPEGFELNSAGHRSADYVDKNGNVIIITESGENAGTSLDTEDAEVSYTTVNGSEAMVIEEDEWQRQGNCAKDSSKLCVGYMRELNLPRIN